MPTLKSASSPSEATAWEGDIPISSRYTAGIAGEAFFREIKDKGRLLGTRCSTCELTYVPPVMFCERCFAQLDDWLPVADTGAVFTYTVLHLDLDEKELPEAEVLAYVKLDGSDGGLIHRLGEVDPDDVEIGMQVEAVWKPPAEREGSILDIDHFRPR
jgi:uncharacterized OB-fold protein